MTLTPKAWKDLPNTTTQISAAALIDLEQRLGAYADAAGAVGPAGPTGPTGPTGPIGPAGLGGNPRGPWASGTTYAIGDEVLGTDSNWYMSLVSTNIGHNPVGDGNIHWAFAASPLIRGWVGAKSNYGAAGDGTTDDTTAINNMLTYIKANGGTGFIEPGVFNIAGVLNGDSNTHGYSLMGAGSGTFPPAATVLKFTGTGAVNGITFNSTFGLDISNIEFLYTALTGDVIHSDGGVHGPDSQFSSFHHCNIAGPTTPTARAGLSLNKTNVWHIHDSIFANCGYGIQMGPDYVVACQIGPNNQFNGNGTAHIFASSDDLEVLQIYANTFEMFTGPAATPYAIAGDDTLFASSGVGIQVLTIQGNWFGDSGGANVNYIHHLTTWSHGKTANVLNNYFFTSSGYAIDGFKGRWNVFGNTFDCVAYNNSGTSGTGDWSTVTLTTIGNEHYGVAQFATTGRPGSYNSFGTEANNTTQIAARLAISGQGVLTLDTVGDANAAEFLVFGSTILLPPGANKGLIYYASASPNPKLILQAPCDGSHTGAVALYSGPTPSPGVSWKDGTKLGFYTQAAPGNEVVQAARAGQLTDSTGGTVSTTLASGTLTDSTGGTASTTLAAGITDTVAKNAIASLAAKNAIANNAIASLAAKVNALETIIHNLGLSA